MVQGCNGLGDSLAFLVSESRQAGIEILPPDINKSSVNFTPEGEQIRFGLLAVKNVGEQIARTIIDERLRRGPFNDFTDFLSRVQHKDLNKKSLESLIKTGCFDSLAIDRRQALENLEEILRFSSLVKKQNGNGMNHSLFGPTGHGANLKLKPAPKTTEQEKLAWEKELLGFYLSGHPLTNLEEKIKKSQAQPIKDVKTIKNEKLIVRIAGLVSKIQKIFTKKGEPMIFAQIEDFSPEPIEVEVFNNTLTKTMNVWQENKAVLIQGRMSWRNSEPKLICDQAVELTA